MQGDFSVQRSMNRRGMVGSMYWISLCLCLVIKRWTLTEAARILDEGFDSLEFTRIPPSLDQVTVSTIEVSSLMEIDVGICSWCE